MTKQVIIIGGPGNGGVAAACIRDMREKYEYTDYEVVGFINDFVVPGEKINGYPVLGKLNDVPRFIDKGMFFIYAIHSISHGVLRMELFKKLGIPDSRLVSIIHPNAFIGEGAVIDPGVMIMANCYVGTNTRIGRCTFLMANSCVSHDSVVGEFCHISMGAICGSLLTIGDGCDVALNATVMERVRLGNFSVVGAAALCLNNVEDYQVVIGNPAKHYKYLSLTESKEEWVAKHSK
ncbi:hypothetical protein [uncultured Draconibacterium sp.]|uniref:hypothetical protein n=1 Tax=uncultured Draconibacterium sp. TaxID=1573823 RepID=UPI0032616E3B